MPSVFLSPSTQPYNKYANGGDEQQYMNLIADAMVPMLEINGIAFGRNRKDTSAGAAIKDSNKGYYDLHLALHSNAASPALVGEIRGVDAYYYTYSYRGKRAADILVKGLMDIYPLPEKVRALANNSFTELTKTNAPAVLLELGYHDNVEDAQWIKDSIQAIAANLTRSLCLYFGIPYIE